ncbi:MAG: prepilin-type N-terminal cleavage/methylation domain-containing protein [Firmicutes bacterium]|nr:prepilin-type N-terminal cleavage/methylation domain-containing protein [Bacillota bacterium]
MVVLKGQRGFTLLEVMVVLMITVLTLTGLLSYQLHCHLLWWKSKQEIELQESLQVAMDKISREARTCTGLSFKNNAFQSEPDSNELRFREGFRTVRYYVDHENELSREFTSIGLPVASHVEELKLKYYNSSGNQISPGTPASEVVLIKIMLTGGMEGIKDLTLVTLVAVRSAQ